MSSVRVAVRARPLLPREEDSPVVLGMKDKSTILYKTEAGVAVGERRDASLEFVYDHSYWSVNPEDPHFTSQEQVFKDLGTLVLDAAFEGYNACIFAYGQTGSGKTYTMMGNEDSPGLIPRICEGLFQRMKASDEDQVSYKVETSYMEIYKEKVRDLLRYLPEAKKRPQSSSEGLRIRNHPKTGPYVEGLSKHEAVDYNSISHLISMGNQHRVTAATKMNDTSSRSHAIFTITFVQAKFCLDLPSETVSKINLVDLAGSERASQTGAEGERLKEGGIINRSLVCLGNVISALAEKSIRTGKTKEVFIPYRDSVLTWLLKDSLGGNSKTVMIATVSPCECSYGETSSTLRYANRAKSIMNKPTVNEDDKVKLIKHLQSEVLRLKAIIEASKSAGNHPESSLMLTMDLLQKEQEVASLKRNWAEKWSNIQRICEERDLNLQSEGIKMTVASEQPHLLGVDDDPLSTGLVLYHLKIGDTTLGHVEASAFNDIALRSEDICPRHCRMVLEDGVVMVYTIDGDCYVNRSKVSSESPVKLSHGDTLQLGAKTCFRFNHPQEAHRLREQSADGSKTMLSDESNFLSPMWSPIGANDQSSNNLQELKEERDALLQKQLAIEEEYERKIQEVTRLLQVEVENKEALEQELKGLRATKRQASLRILASTPTKGRTQSLLISQLSHSLVPPERSSRTSSDPEQSLVVLASDTKSPDPEQSLFVPQTRSPDPEQSIVHPEDPRDSFFEAAFSSQDEANFVSSEPTLESSEVHSSSSPEPQSTPASPTKSDSEDSEVDDTCAHVHVPLRQLESSPVQSSRPIPIPSFSPSFSPPLSPPIQQCCVSLAGDGSVLFEADSREGAGVDRRRSHSDQEKYLLLEANGDANALDEPFSSDHRKVEDPEKNEKRLRQEAEAVKNELKAKYENQLAQKEIEKSALRGNVQSLEHRLQAATSLFGASPRRRSNAMTECTDGSFFPERPFDRNPSPSSRPSSAPLYHSHRECRLKADIGAHFLRGDGFFSYHVYEVRLNLGRQEWTVHRKYQEFCNFHSDMVTSYPEFSSLVLPPSKWFGVKNEDFVKQRKLGLKRYLNAFLALVPLLPESPLREVAGKRLDKQTVQDFHPFFTPGLLVVK